MVSAKKNLIQLEMQSGSEMRSPSSNVIAIVTICRKRKEYQQNSIRAWIRSSDYFVQNLILNIYTLHYELLVSRSCWDL